MFRENQRDFEAVEKLVRSLEAGLPAKQPELVDASLTVHLNLTDGSLAGSAATLQAVSASVTRDGYPVASGEGLPVPDPAGFFYSLSLVWQAYPCGADYCYPSKLEPGDQIELQYGAESTFSTVPQLSVEVDPDTSLVSGTAPPEARLEITR